MSRTNANCPESSLLKQFLLGQLSVQEIEECQQHLSDCDPCMETVEGLMVNDTFTDLARQSLQSPLANADAESVGDDRLISGMIERMEKWKLDQSGSIPMTNNQLAEDKAAEVQRLLGNPVEPNELGRLAHYRIVRQLGSGSTGVVYLADDTQLQRPVVIKILRPSLGDAARHRFVAEARATAAIDHTNVVTIYEVGNSGPLAYIAMQWLPGQTLEQKLDECETLPLDQLTQIATQISQGLAAAHANGLIHRDIKPANIWIPDQRDEAKILDFGLVRITDEDPQLTCTGLIAGTPCYMSPEQSRGDQLDPRSDLFSLGCLMYQSLTGRLPFRSENALATLRSIQQDQPMPPNELDPSIPADMSDLVMCLLEKSPGRRPPDADSVVCALENERKNWGFEVPEPIAFAYETKPRRKTSSAIWKSIAALIAGALLGVGGFMYGPQVVRIVTNHGEIEIDTKVDDVKIEVVENGEVVRVIDLATDQSIEVKAGQYEIRPVGGNNSVSIDKNQLTLSRGEKEIVRITRRSASGSLAAAANPEVPPRFAPSFPNDEIEKVEAGPEKDYQTAKQQFDKGEIGRLELLESEAALMEHNQQFEILEDKTPKRLIEIRREQLELISQLANEAKSEQEKSALQATRKSARKALSKARIALSEFERSEGRPQSQPVYDGKTYEELLAIVQTEHDLKLLNPALKGVANLAGDAGQKEMLEQVMLAARRQGQITGSSEDTEFRLTVQQVLRSLDVEKMALVFINELSSGTDNSRSHFFSNNVLPCFLESLFRKMDSHLDRSSAVVEEIVDALLAYAKSNGSFKEPAAFLQRFEPRWIYWNLAENSAAREIFQGYFDSYLKDSKFSERLGDSRERNPRDGFGSRTRNYWFFVKNMPQIDGLIDLIVADLDHLKSQIKVTREKGYTDDSGIGKIFPLYDALPNELKPEDLLLDWANDEIRTMIERKWRYHKFDPTTTTTTLRPLRYLLRSLGCPFPNTMVKVNEIIQAEKGSLLLEKEGDKIIVRVIAD